MIRSCRIARAAASQAINDLIIIDSDHQCARAIKVQLGQNIQPCHVAEIDRATTGAFFCDAISIAIQRNIGT